MFAARPVVGCQVQLHPLMRPAVKDSRIHVELIEAADLPEPFRTTPVLGCPQENRPCKAGESSGEGLRCDDALAIRALREAWRQRFVDFIGPCSHHGR